MRVSKKDQEKINSFFREEVASGFSNPVNCLRFQGGTSEHRRRIFEVCEALYSAGIPFFTEVRLKSGLRPDIVCPSHVVQCIEVMHTENVSSFIKRKQDKIPKGVNYLLLRTDKEFDARDFL